MGSDGKTGETLVKSALAPMFAPRNLEVMSWQGYNILGNLDGKVLQNKDTAQPRKKAKTGCCPISWDIIPIPEFPLIMFPLSGTGKPPGISSISRAF